MMRVLTRYGDEFFDLIWEVASEVGIGGVFSAHAWARDGSFFIYR